MARKGLMISSASARREKRASMTLYLVGLSCSDGSTAIFLFFPKLLATRLMAPIVILRMMHFLLGHLGLLKGM